MSTLWTVRKILDWTVEYFQKKHLPDARLSAELLLAHVLHLNRVELYLQFERIVTPAERETFKALIQRRSQREPLQYILGEAEFYGLRFKVKPDVLIPRPETELLVDSIIEYLRQFPIEKPEILDIGTGSGCIAIAVKHQVPAAAVTAVDVSPAALDVARENARIHEVDIEWIAGDGIRFLAETSSRYHVIVSNPPYIAENEWASLQPEVKQFEPRQALVSGSTGLEFYEQIIPLAGKRLHPGGRLVLEIGYNQGETVPRIMETHGFRYELKHDYQHINRVVIGYYE